MLYESVHRRLLFLSQTERERLRMERERYKTASGEIATYRMCWQDTTAEINSVKRCGKHPAPAPLHTPLIWDDTQETAERRRPRWRLWLEKKEAATLISWDIGTIIAWLPVTFVQCMPYMNRRWSAFYSINVSYTSRCLGCQEGNRKWCVRERRCRPEAAPSHNLIVQKKTRSSGAAGLHRSFVIN